MQYLFMVYAAHFISCASVLFLLPEVMNIYGLQSEATSLTYKVVWIYAIVEMFIRLLAYTTPTTFRATGDARCTMVFVILSMIFLV